MNKFVGLVKSGWFVALLGVLLVSLLVWFGGPFLGIGKSEPLSSPVVRLVVIVLLVVAWALWLQLKQLRAASKTKQMAGELAGQEAKAGAGAGDDRSAAERTKLQAAFQDAIETLRKKRRGGGSLYELPWYAVIGPPGAGKSTLLQNSGLNFPLSDRFGKEALRGIGGTRNCDWWFTDEAVFLDTAGRYTTQDSDSLADASAWEEFLKLLRRYRKRRPLNGVIVAISLSDLLTLDEAGRQAHVVAIRRRLDELTRHLNIGVPAYLVFTKCDLVAGFTELFDDLTPAQRAQVWGVTFPLEKTLDGLAAPLFAPEFDLLLERVSARMLDRLHSERDAQRRVSVLSFPQQLASLRETARQFVEGIFGASQYGSPLLLRGAYLTSGTQEGMPIDRMMNAVARTFGLDAARVAPPDSAKRTFFVERLLRDVIFRESGFAGVNPKLERQKLVLQLVAYAAFALVTVLLVLAFASSAGKNGRYIDQVQAALDKYQPGSLSTAPDRPAYFALVLQRLEALSGALDVANQYNGHVPTGMRFGLYQGKAIGRSVRDAYFREMNAILLPGIASQLRQEVIANASDPQALYYYLKGYLMLGQPQHMKADQLVALTSIEWAKLFPNDALIQQALAKHVSALIAAQGSVRPQVLDDALVEQARNTLRSADLATLIYGALKLEMQAANAPPLSLEKELGLLGNVFRRRSGAPLSDPLPSAYTQPVFWTQANHGIDLTVKRFVEDDWVFGASKIDPFKAGQLTRQVVGLYEQDYVHAWDAILADLQLQAINNIQDASAIAAKLSGPNSPLRLFLKVVRDNTAEMMRAPADAGDQTMDAAKKAAEAKLQQNSLAVALAKAAGAQSGGATAAPGDAIAAHFDTLNKLTTGAPGQQPIDHTIMALDGLSKALLTMGGDFASSAGQPNPTLLQARQEASQLPQPVSAWVAALTGKSEALVASGTSGAIGEQFHASVAKDCGAFVRGRYPFSESSATDIPLQNFGELFGVGGHFDAFFKQSLEKLVDASGPTWHWKSGPGAVAGPPGILAQAQAADRIKQEYFRGGQTPEVDFTLQTPTLDAGLNKLTMEVDGQKFEYTLGGTASAAMKWPGPSPGHVSIGGYDSSGRLLGSFDYLGDWAFFRALQAGHLQRQSETGFVATYVFAGKSAHVALQANNLKNPFLSRDLQNFRCGG